MTTRVLLVEDDDAVRATAEALLATAYEVESVADAEAGWVRLQAGNWDVLCTDFVLPGMTGLELIRLAQQLPEAPGCLLMTGYQELLRSREGRSRTFSLLVKPYRPELLLETVARCADQARVQRTLQRVEGTLQARASGGTH